MIIIINIIIIIIVTYAMTYKADTPSATEWKEGGRAVTESDVQEY